MDRLNILILDDERGGIQHLHDALNGRHAITWTRTIDAAMNELAHNEKPFDIIICGTHLISESMIDFLMQVKKKAESKKIPFICFRAATTDFAEKFDSSIEQTIKMLGAAAYISVPEVKDSVRLRELVEAQIRPLVTRSAG